MPWDARLQPSLTADFSLRFDPAFRIAGQSRAKAHEAFILCRIDVEDDEDEDERDEFHMARSELPKWYYHGASGQRRLAAARQAMQDAAAARAASSASSGQPGGPDAAMIFVEEDHEKKVGKAISSAAWTFVRITEDGKKEHIVDGQSRGLERHTKVMDAVPLMKCFSGVYARLQCSALCIQAVHAGLKQVDQGVFAGY